MNNAEKEYNALANALAALSTNTAPNWRAGVLATWARGYMETRPDYTAIDALTDCLAELQNGQTLTGQYWCDKYPKLYDALTDTGHLDGKGSVVARALELIDSGGQADCLPTHGASREPLPEITSTPVIYTIQTDKDETELRRIFAALVEGGFIDGSGPDSLADYLNVFNPDTTKQGRIKWIKRGKNKQINKLAFCQFLRLFGVVPFNSDAIQLLIKYALAITGLVVGESSASGSDSKTGDYSRLKTIIDGEN